MIDYTPDYGMEYISCCATCYCAYWMFPVGPDFFGEAVSADWRGVVSASIGFTNYKPSLVVPISATHDLNVLFKNAALWRVGIATVSSP